jgi:acetyl/propionyl-CoA carboxylase alpha subunit
MAGQTLLIANRGEIACRIARTAKEMGVTTVSIHSEADAGARHVRLCDRSQFIGSGAVAANYLNIDVIIAAAKESEASAIHPGYGFLSESAELAARCAREGITFVGPDPEVISAMGDKERARQIAKRAGVPIMPGTARIEELSSLSLRKAASEIGYPLLVKAVAGGGGIGLRPVESAEELESAATSTHQLAERAFANGAIYLERLVSRARHIEVQIFGFGDGEAIHLHDRECSIQRRYQKIIEEGRAPNLPEEIRRQMANTAVALTRSCAYSGAGTVEFLYDEACGEYFFIEMNTRLQVEHPVTEEITGVDLVEWQLLQAFDKAELVSRRTQTMPTAGHAIELRVCAEKPERKFLPSPGLLTKVVLPRSDNIRIDSGYETGDVLPSLYDNLIMKIIAHGPDRSGTIALLKEALRSTTIEGISTNLAFLGSIIEHPEFIGGRLHTNFVDQNIAVLLSPPNR